MGGTTLGQLRNLILGPPGTYVNLSFLREMEVESFRFDVDLLRGDPNRTPKPQGEPLQRSEPPVAQPSATTRTRPILLIQCCDADEQFLADVGQVAHARLRSAADFSTGPRKIAAMAAPLQRAAAPPPPPANNNEGRPLQSAGRILQCALVWEEFSRQAHRPIDVVDCRRLPQEISGGAEAAHGCRQRVAAAQGRKYANTAY